MEVIYCGWKGGRVIIMRESTSGYIIYDKEYRAFRLSDGNFVDSMLEAQVWKYESDAQVTIDTFDEPENYEIWEVERSIYTVI